jgi:gliding motility-associated-like protein
LKKILFLLFFYFAFTSIAFTSEKNLSSNLFWIGGSGNWSDSTHWARKSGGVGGFAVPTSNDNVIFDSKSFTSDGEEVLIEGNATCLNMSWENLVSHPILNGSSASSIYVHGSLAFAHEMINGFKGKVVFNSSSKANTIFSANHFFVGDIIFDNENGEWKLVDDIRTVGVASFYLIRGTFNTNNKNIHCNSFISSGDKKRSLLLGSSHVSIRNQWNVNNTTNLFFDSGTSEITLPQNKNDNTFRSGNLKYNLITASTFTCSPSGDGCDYFTITITTTPDSCNGAPYNGTASATITGGTGPFTFSWNSGLQSTPIATGLSPNTYLVEVTDGSGHLCACSGFVTSPPIAVASTTVTPALCNGVCNGAAGVSSTSGGVAPNTYLWNPSGQTTASATGLCGGVTYSVIITDSYHCTIQKTRTIIDPTALDARGASTNLNCFGICNGTASVNPSGGTGGYTYTWLPSGATTSGISSLCANTYTCTVKDANNCSSIYITTITQPTQLTTTITGTSPVCNGVCTGSISVTANGGSGGYTYNWMPGGYTTSSISGLCANTYSLTLSDANGCTKTTTITLTQPSALTSSPTGTNITCFNQCDGTVNANAGGGTPNYTYQWAPGACSAATCSSLCTGNYTVTVTDFNGCTIQKNIILTEPAVLIIAPSGTDETCAGSCNGTVQATMSGGTAPFTYAWSPGGCTTSACSGLCAAIYSITVIDANNCITTSSVTVSLPSAIVPNLTSVSALCFGGCNGSVKSTTSGGTSPYTYNWSTGCTTSSCSGLCAGNYTCTVTDAVGCAVTRTVTVDQPILFTAAIASASPNPLNCNGDCDGTVLTNLNGGTPTYLYSWSNGSTTGTLTGLCVGGYSLTATDANGCTATTSVVFTQPTVLSPLITPTNPTCNGGCNGSITANVSGGGGTYTYSWLPGGQTTSAITAQCTGNYQISILDNKGCSNTQTLALTAPTVVVANGSILSNVTCSGDCDAVATASPGGGTGSYTYLWTGGATTQSVSNLCAGSVNVLVQDANGCSDLDVLNISQPSTLFSLVSSATSSCNLCTGSASITTVGGTSPYTYSWAPGGLTTSAATGLCVGNYTVSIADANSCTNVVTVSIIPQINVIMSTSGPSVSCPGTCDGSAQATPSGGAVPYTYSWTTIPTQTIQSVSGLCAGNYTVNVTDNTGCTSTKTVSFSAPVVLTSTMSSTSASCGLCNGTATVVGSGGTGPLTYTWSGFPVQAAPTATGLCQGNYTVTVTDGNNCSASNTVTVGNVSAISNNASTTLSTCGSNNDGAICITPSGGVPGYTYLWAPNGETGYCISGLSAGIYTVAITDATGCSANFQIGVGNTSGPTVTVTYSANPTCNASCDGAITVSATGSGPFDYLWSPNGEITPNISALCAGTYIVQVDDNVPCTSFSSIVISNPPQISSNPNITDASCKGGSNGSICLAPSGGNSPYNFRWNGGAVTTASCITGLSAGTYTVIIADATSCDDTVLISVAEPSMLTVSITPTNVFCNGNANGTATAVVSGGTTLYTYAWSTGSVLPGIAGLSSGNYSVTVTDNNGCIATSSVSISQPISLTTTASPTNITCKSLCDGSISITASGGTSAYTYAWLPGGETTSSISGLCFGNYAATITDSQGCTSTNTVIITEPIAISATVTPTNVTCFGGCNGIASASVSGGTGAYSYLWNAGGLTTSAVTGLCANAYTLTTSDVNGCSTTNLFSITAPTILQAGITNTPTSCTSTCDGTATSSPQGGAGGYSYLWSNGQTTSTATGLCVNTYTLTLSDANGCSIIKTTNIISPSALTQVSSIGGATCLICNGTISVLGSNGTGPYSYFWSTGATTATITGLCAGVYIDTVKDAKGCISIDTIAVANTTGPVINISGTNISCFGSCNGTATVSPVTGNGPPWLYSWSFTTPTQTTQTATGLCPNQYFGSVTDMNGCVAIANVTVTEPTQLKSNAVATNATCFGICDGSITTSASGGTGAFTYNWLPGGQTTASILSQCVGTYTLTLKDANNCSITNTVTIGQNTILSSTVTATNNTCNTSCNGTGAISIVGGTAPYTYLWTGGQTTSAVTGLCAGNYTITVNDLVGCVNINTITITAPTALVANVTSVNPLCNASCNGGVSSTISGGTASYTYLWMPGGLTTSSVTGLCAGGYTLSIVDANLCAVTNTIILTEPAAISATNSVSDANCINTCNGSINISPAGGTTPYVFSWFPGGQSSQNITGLCSGNFSVTITDANLCAAVTYTMSVGIKTLVAAAAGKDTSFCLGGVATLMSTSTNASSVSWYQLPTWSLVGSTNTVSVSPPVGNTSYALIAFNGICSDTDTVMVTVFSYPVVVANNTTICAGSNTTICALGANSYQWYQLPTWTPIASGTCITVSPSVGITNYGIIGMNGMCSDTDSVSVTVLAMPIANAGNDTAFCAGGKTTLCSKLSQNGFTFNWFDLPLWTPRDTDTCTTVSPLVTTNYVLIVSNGICSDTDSVSVIVHLNPIANAGSSVTILASGSTILNGNGNGSYLWTPAAGLSTTTDPNPTATPTATTTYVLLVTDTSGCTSRDTVKITIIGNVIPNDGISPNGDGINDIWIIPGIEAFSNSLVQIYNRWGELLFSTDDYKSNKWDGTFKGKALPVGTYYYVINLNSDLFKDPVTGPITILK